MKSIAHVPVGCQIGGATKSQQKWDDQVMISIDNDFLLHYKLNA